MRKLIPYGLFICFVFLSCTKTTDTIENKIPNPSKTIEFFAANKESREYYLKEIENAKIFFETNIITLTSHRFRKSPVWEKAYNAKMASGAEKVLVPLKYDKEYSFKTSFSGNEKFTLENQSFLSIYKNGSGNYQAEVVTIYPDQATLQDLSRPFQGLLTIDDWNENRIRTYLHKDGRLYNVEKPRFNFTDNSTQANGRTSEVCLIVDWYWCEGWETYISQCTYLGTMEYENCADFEALQPPGEEGEYVYEYNTSKPWKWPVAVSFDDWLVHSWETLYGKVGGTNPPCNVANKKGQFTGIQHVSSYLVSGVGYTWTQYGNYVEKVDPCECKSQINGRVTRNSTGAWTYHENEMLAWWGFDFP